MFAHGLFLCLETTPWRPNRASSRQIASDEPPHQRPALNPVTCKSMARGGKRKGAGRPKGDPDELYRRVSLTLGPTILERLDAYALEHKLNRSAAAELLLKLGLERDG